MKVELTEFTTGGSYKIRKHTGSAAETILLILSFREKADCHLEKIELDRSTVFVSRYASGRIYRVWVQD